MEPRVGWKVACFDAEAGSREFWGWKQLEDVSCGAGELGSRRATAKARAGVECGSLESETAGGTGAGFQSGHELRQVPAPLRHILLIC